jgi:hypothetical protein
MSQSPLQGKPVCVVLHDKRSGLTAAVPAAAAAGSMRASLDEAVRVSPIAAELAALLSEHGAALGGAVHQDLSSTPHRGRSSDCTLPGLLVLSAGEANTDGTLQLLSWLRCIAACHHTCQQQ